MERLTKYQLTEGGVPFVVPVDDGVSEQDCMQKLAAYEDTWLEPKEVQNVVSFENEKMFPYSEITLFGKSIWYWKDLLQADIQGRLVVLPCKIGDPVYVTHCIFGEKSVSQGEFNLRHVNLIGKTVFLSREEAEASLRNEHDA